MPKPVEQVLPGDGPDYRWAGPAHRCLCGNTFMHVVAMFDEGKIAFYFLDMACAVCGARLIAPTEVDDERVEEA